MSEELIEVMRFLSVEGYVIHTPQNYYIFTNKFYSDFTKQDVGIVPNAEAVIAKSQTVHVAVPLGKLTAPVVSDAYKQFIMDSGVPRRLVNPRGESYDANQYSAKGAKAFGKILDRIQSGAVDYELLIRSTQLYYKSSVGYKLKIGNYIADGAWETHYHELAQSLVFGTLEQHIKQELQNDNTGNSRYRLEQRTGEGAGTQIQKKSTGWPERKEPRP